MESDHEFEVERTDSSNEDFIRLVVLLDQELGNTYSEQYDFYHQYNQIDNLENVIVVYQKRKPLGCGAIKPYDSETMEVKRMYTSINHRGKGVASLILRELEKWTMELGFENCILETGTKQYSAIKLYERKGYKSIPNYGQYVEVKTSLCFMKSLR